MYKFQSTPPRRRRPRRYEGRKRNKYFNPRLREGGDAVDSITLALKGDFNPRLREGGDVMKKTGDSEARFQSTPPRRRRHVTTEATDQTVPISIHASEKEATATYCDTSTIMYISSLNNFFVRYF